MGSSLPSASSQIVAASPCLGRIAQAGLSRANHSPSVIAGAVLDTLAGRDSFDVVAEYTAPLPIIVIAQMLGVDPTDMEQFKRWSEALAQTFNPAPTAGQSVELVTAQQRLSA